MPSEIIAIFSLTLPGIVLLLSLLKMLSNDRLRDQNQELNHCIKNLEEQITQLLNENILLKSCTKSLRQELEKQSQKMAQIKTPCYVVTLPEQDHINLANRNIHRPN
ncbi:MAG: hypothetical protein AB8G05_05590 [Oligoflexales bacterium]